MFQEDIAASHQLLMRERKSAALVDAPGSSE